MCGHRWGLVQLAVLPAGKKLLSGRPGLACPVRVTGRRLVWFTGRCGRRCSHTGPPARARRVTGRPCLPGPHGRGVVVPGRSPPAGSGAREPWSGGSCAGLGLRDLGGKPLGHVTPSSPCHRRPGTWTLPVSWLDTVLRGAQWPPRTGADRPTAAWSPEALGDPCAAWSWGREGTPLASPHCTHRFCPAGFCPAALNGATQQGSQGPSCTACHSGRTRMGPACPATRAQLTGRLVPLLNGLLWWPGDPSRLRPGPLSVGTEGGAVWAP